MTNFIFNLQNYIFNPYALPHFLVGSLIAIEGIFVFCQSKKTVTPTAYLVFAITAGVWLMGVGLGSFASNEAVSLFWYRYFSWFGIIFVTPAVYWFSASWDPELLKEKTKFTFLNYFVALFFYLISIFSDQIVDGLFDYSTGYFPKAGPLECLFIIWFYFVMTLSFVNFVRLHGKEKNPSQKKNIRLMFVAFATGFFGSVEYLPNYGVHIFPAAFLPMFIFASIMGYCVVRYKLMDIETVVHKTLMWLVSSIVTIFPFALFVHFSHQLFSGLSAPAMTAVVTAASFLFYLYYQQIQPRLSRVFQQADQNLQRAFSKFNEELVLLKNLRELVQRSVRLLRRNLYVKAISIYLRDDEKGQLVPVLIKGLRGLKPASLSDAFIQWAERSNEVILADFAAGNPEIAEFKNNLSDYFAACQARIAVPLVANKKIIGMINLGKKENLRRYSASEIRFLTQLKFPLTIALSNSMQYENVSKLYNQVQSQNDRLKELDRLKSEFLANTSHELRTPLNGILGLVESIIDGADGPLSDPQRRHLQMIIESGANLKELINNLLELSRLESGQMNMNIKPFNVLNVIDAVLALMDGVAKKKKLLLSRTGEKNLKDVYGDPVKIQRVLMNLVGNALKFTHEGSVTVEVKEHEGSVNIAVIDTGIGITEDDQRVVFERFRQADGSATRQYEGTGLGLSIAREIVRFHGSDIHVSSEINKGSRFSFSLTKKPFIHEASSHYSGGAGQAETVAPDMPAERAELSNKAYALHEDPEFADAVHGNGETVLIIDDNEVNREVVKTRLEIHGYRVIEAADGLEGMEKTIQQLPDLVILDLMMPRMSGYEFCKKLRETHSADHLPVIMLTAKTDMGDKIYGLNLGANDYIAKPFNKEELIARVGILIRIRKMTSELIKWNVELEKRVDQRTKELAKTQEQLIQAEKLATIGTLAGGVAHEINNPLTAVLTNAQILKMTANEDDAETISLIEEGAKRCQLIVQKLLKYSRQPQQEPSFAEVGLERVIRSTVSMLQYQLLQENVEISVTKEGSDIVRGIGHELEQVFTNLIVNSRDAVRGSGRKGLIQIQMVEKEKDIQVKVADNGTGIAQEHIKRIFDPFFTTKDVGEGTGLGLAVSHSILQKHNCRIEVHSVEGKGTEFLLLFPKPQSLELRGLEVR